jgi:CTP synthase (UTP-ammonia lyase)
MGPADGLIAASEVQEISIGIIGDRREGSESQVAIAPALRHAADHLGVTVTTEWVSTVRLSDDDPVALLARYDGLWCAPGSPFDSMEGALAGIEVARCSRRPFLGTCAGFQHGVIEFARNACGIESADHAEYDHTGGLMLIDELACSLAGQTMTVILADDATRDLYGAGEVTERYYCRFGLDESYLSQLELGGMVVGGRDAADGSTRILRLAGHPFYYLTLFVPQTSSKAGAPHPVVLAYVRAVASRSTGADRGDTSRDNDAEEADALRPASD